MPSPLSVKAPKERLVVRVDQPVENVEFKAHTLLRSGDGGILTPSSRKLQYKWYRSRKRLSCAYGDCPNIRNLGVVESLANSRRYCSNTCFAADWANSSGKSGAASAKGPSGNTQRPCDASNGMLMNGEMSAHFDKEDLLDSLEGSLNAQDDRDDTEDWEYIGSDKSIIPQSKDVGHRLKVECVAVPLMERTRKSWNPRKLRLLLGSPVTTND